MGEKSFDQIPYFSGKPTNNSDYTNVSASGIDAMSSYKTYFTVIKALMGVTFVTFGLMFKTSGIVMGSIMILFVNFLTYYTISLVSEITNKCDIQVRCLADITGYLYGEKVYKWTWILIIISQMGIAAATIKFFSVLFSYYTCQLGLLSCNDDKLAILIPLFMIIPLGLIKDYAKFNVYCMIGNIFSILGLLLCAGYSFYHAFKERHFQTFSPNLFSLAESFIFFSIVCRSNQLLFVSLEIRNCMAEPRHLDKIIKNSLLMITPLNIILPIIYYYGFKDDVKNVILFNIPINTIIGAAAQISYSLNVLISIPYRLFPIFNFTDIWIENSERNDKVILNNSRFLNTNKGQGNPNEDDQDENNNLLMHCIESIPKSHSVKYYFSRIFVSSFTWFIAFEFSDIIYLLAVVGAFTAIFNYIPPFIMYENFFKTHGLFLKRKRGKKMNNFLLLTAVISIAISSGIITKRLIV